MNQFLPQFRKDFQFRNVLSHRGHRRYLLRKKRQVEVSSLKS